MDPSTKTLRERLPSVLLDKLEVFRGDVRRIKLQETLFVGASVILVGFLFAFLADRLFESNLWMRLSALFGLLGVLAFLTWQYLAKTVLSTEEWTGLARLLEKKFPGPGDRLLGIIEIGADDSEWTRSKTLSQAAISQVSAELRVTDFDKALPKPRFQALGSGLFAAGFIILFMAFTIPDPVVNTAARWSAPWMEVERYTFAQPENVNDLVYVARGEDYSVFIPMKEDSPWTPASIKVKLQGRDSFSASLDSESNGYLVKIPSHSDDRNLKLKIGDHRLALNVEPKDRSSVETAGATVHLPGYLKRSQPDTKDVRAGLLTMVQGSSAFVNVSVDRELQAVRSDLTDISFEGQDFEIPVQPQESLDGYSQSVVWTDQFGLSGLSKFDLNVRVVEDEKPGIVIENLSRTKVLLETDTLDFLAQVTDDFGIREVGMEWVGEGDPDQGSKPTSGEKLFASHSPDQANLQLVGTFSAQDLEISPQPLKVKFFVSDFKPDRERVYSPEYLFYVLNEDQHFQWMTSQLTRWQQDALLVKNKEEQLLKTNQEIRDMSSDQLNDDKVRAKIKTQASAERANGRRLSALSKNGESLLKEAARNSQFGPGTLEDWAEILNVLKDISGNRMPSVEDLLKEASNQPMVASNSQSQGSSSSDENKVESSGENQEDQKNSSGSDSKKESGPMVGQNRNQSGSSGGGESEDKKDEEDPSNKIPALVDTESSLQPKDPKEKQTQTAQSSPPPGGGKFGLPGTTLQDFSKGPESCPTTEKMTEAVVEQENLLAEFEKVSDELNRILADLEGSTFVKRLKAASRAQTQMARSLSAQVSDSFGLSTVRQNNSSKEVFSELKEQDRANLTKLDEIQQDMDAYYQRKQYTKFKNVLDEMEKLDPFTGLDTKSEVMGEEVGWSFAMTEYWADTFDRWAEDLVDPASGGT